MAETKHEEVLGDVLRGLLRLGLSKEARHEVMALVRGGVDGAAHANGLPDAADPRVQARIAGAFYKQMQRNAAALGSSSFGMLNMLLDLFVAHEQGRSVSVSSLCIASGAASTTALRQIAQLESRGLVTRYDDERDGRRSWVRPNDPAIELVRSMIEEIAIAMCG